MQEPPTNHRFTWRTCDDGSRTLHDSVVDETYKSSHAAQTETWSVFLTPGILEHPAQQNPGANFHILELGFGLGTNFRSLVEFSSTQKNKIFFTSLEKDLSGADFFQTHQPHEATKKLLQNHFLEKNNLQAKILVGDFLFLLQNTPSEIFDCIFFDPFSPKINPEAWGATILQECYRVLRREGRLVTYSVSRVAKDGLQKAGFQVEKRALPQIMRKRSSLLARK